MVLIIFSLLKQCAFLQCAFFSMPRIWNLIEGNRTKKTKQNKKQNKKKNKKQNKKQNKKRAPHTRHKSRDQSRDLLEVKNKNKLFPWNCHVVCGVSLPQTTCVYLFPDAARVFFSWAWSRRIRRDGQPLSCSHGGYGGCLRRTPVLIGGTEAASSL